MITEKWCALGNLCCVMMINNMRILQDNLLEYSRQEIEEIHRLWKANLPTKADYLLTFGITSQQAAKIRRNYLHIKLLDDINHKNKLLGAVIRFGKDSWLLADELMEVDKEISRTKAALSFNGAYARFDVAQLKQIPIDRIVSVNAAGFFKVRDEKTPSCKWFKESNVWVDFGNDNRKHDVIDLVQLVEGLSFYDACKYLNQL